MIPKLFESTETAFTSNGLGALHDAITCYVEEERNGKYELKMEYPVTGIHFEDLAITRYILAKPYDGAQNAQPFSIYSMSKPINGKCTVYAEHISYQLASIPVMPTPEQTSPSAALTAIKAYAAENCPFTFWTDKTSSGAFQVKKPKSIRACLGGEEGSVLQAFGGGEYLFDLYDVKLFQSRGANNGAVIRYGKNLTDLTQEESIANTITGVCPYWYGTEADGTEAIVTLTEKVLHSSNAVNFPYQRTAVLDCTAAFESKPTETQLRTYAQSYMENNSIGVPSVNMKVKFLPLWQSEEYKDRANIERVGLCDTVTVQFEKLGVSATAKVIKTKYDVLKERYSEIELGESKTNLAGTVKADISDTKDYVDATQSFLRQRLIAAMQTILNSTSDGDIVFTYDQTTGARTNIMAMDSSDPSTAKKILLINYAGIGGFTNGLNDQSGYRLAITTDGKVNAEAINAGTILAALILGSTFKIGGSGTGGNGTLQVYDANDNLIGQWNKNGITASGDLHMVKEYTRYLYNSSITEKAEIHGGSGSIPYYDVSGEHSGGTGFVIVGKSSDQYGYGGGERGNHIYRSFELTHKSYDGNEDAMGNYFLESVRSLEKYVENISVIEQPMYICGQDGGVNEYTADDAHRRRVTFKTTLTVHGRALDTTQWDSLATDEGVLDYHEDANELKYHIKGGERVSSSTTNKAYEIILDGEETQTQALGVTLTGQIKFVAGDLYLRFEKRNDGTIIAKIYGNDFQLASSSSRRYKQDIKPITSPDLDPNRLLNLVPKQFRYKKGHSLQYADMAGQTIPGFIAEDVAEAYPSAVIHNPETGEIESWDERRIIPGLLALIQEHEKRIGELEECINSMSEKSMRQTTGSLSST